MSTTPATTASFRDPWLAQEAKKVVDSYLADVSTAPPQFSALPLAQRDQYIADFRAALLADKGLNAYCKDQRIRRFDQLQAALRPYQPFLPHVQPPALQALLGGLLNATAATLTHADLVTGIMRLRAGEKYLRRAKSAASQAERVEAQEQGKAAKQTTTLLQRLQQAERNFDKYGYARAIGRRIAAYLRAIRTNTPESITRARYLWNELQGSLYGWQAANGSKEIHSLRKRVVPGKDKALHLFLSQGYEPTTGSGGIYPPAQTWTEAPAVLRTWNTNWQGGVLAAAMWLYEANNRALSLADFLAIMGAGGYADDDTLTALFGQSDIPATWCVTGDNLDTLTPAATFTKSGNLFRHHASLTKHYGAYDRKVASTLAARDEAATPAEAAALEATIDPAHLRVRKIAAATQQLSAMKSLLKNVGTEWSDLAAELTPRDPWVPLAVLSAYVSNRCQFPWPVWNRLYRHPDSTVHGAFSGHRQGRSRSPDVSLGGESPGDTPWFYPAHLAPPSRYDYSNREPGRFDPEQFVTSYPDQSRLDYPLGAYDPTERRIEGGQVWSDRVQYKYGQGNNDYRGGAQWTRLTDLTQVRGFTPWRLEVVRLSDESGNLSGIFAYRTFDWYNHEVEPGEDYAAIRDLYKLPTETEARFKDRLIAHNGPCNLTADEEGAWATRDERFRCEGDYQNPIHTLLAGDSIEGAMIRVPRIIPNDLFRRAGGGRGKVDKKGKLKLPSFGYKTPIQTAPAVEIGVSPISMLFLAYINNDYSTVPRGITRPFFNRKVLYRLMTGRSAGEPSLPSAPRTVPIMAAHYAAVDAVRARIIGALYDEPWRNADGYFSNMEPPANAIEAAEAATKEYTGTEVEVEVKTIDPVTGAVTTTMEQTTVQRNPGLIPRNSTAADEFFGHGNYRFSLGLLTRICASKGDVVLERDPEDNSIISQQIGTRLWKAEIDVGVPDPLTGGVGGQVVRVARELKGRLKQRRIEEFSSLFVKDFLAYLAKPTATDTPDKRATFRAAVEDNYNAVWSGYFDASQYHPDLYDPWKQLPDPERVDREGDPMPPALSDHVVRWGRDAVEGEAEPPAVLSAPGTTPKRLYDFQSTAAFRLDDKQGGLLAFDVGVGKTHTAMAAVGWAKQRGHIRRPMFVVPKSIKLKWWKDLRETYPDWNIAVLGLTLRPPQAVGDLSAKRRKDLTTTTAAFQAAFLAVGGYSVDATAIAGGASDAHAAATKAAFGWLVRGGSPSAYLPSQVTAALTPKVAALARNPIALSWCKDSPDTLTQKMADFCNGYYDVMLTDEYDFKNIGVNEDAVVGHLLRASGSRYTLYRKAFSKAQTAPGTALRKNVVVALSYTHAEDDVSKARFLRATLDDDVPPLPGTDTPPLWPWCPNPMQDVFPYIDAVQAYIATALIDYAGKWDAEFWRQTARAFFAEQLQLPRSQRWTPALVAFRKLLLPPMEEEPDNAFSGDPASWTIEPDDVPEEESGRAPFAVELSETLITALDAAGVAIPLAKGTAVEAGDTLPLVYPAVGVIPGKDYYPDGVTIPKSKGQYAQACYYTGRLVLKAINLAPTYDPATGLMVNEGGWPDTGLPAKLPAKDAAEAMAAYINANPGAAVTVGLGSAGVRVVPSMTAIKTKSKRALAQKWARTLAPDADKPEKSGSGRDAKTVYLEVEGRGSRRRLRTLSELRAKIPALYYAQPNPKVPPSILWDATREQIEAGVRSLGVDCLVIDEAHGYKGLFTPMSRGGKVEYLGGGTTSTKAWVMDYFTSAVKARGGRVMLLTATPAKQSPLDFYNTIQYIGAPGLGGDANLFSQFFIATPEQFISRFVRIEDRVVINAKGEARRAPAASAFINLTREFGEVFRRYADRKTVADVPALRGKTVTWLVNGHKHHAEGGLDKRQGYQGPCFFDAAEIDPVTGKLPHVTKIEIPGFNPTLALHEGLTDPRFRIRTGEGSADYGIGQPGDTVLRATRDYGWNAVSNTGYVNVYPPVPVEARDEESRKGEDWAVYVNAKVPLAPIPAKPLVNMDDIQRALYESYQRALSRMYLYDTKLERVKVGGTNMEITRDTIFSRLSRVALHPELEIVETKGGAEIEIEEDDSEAEEGEEIEATPSPAVTERYTYGLALSLDPMLDAFQSVVNAQSMSGSLPADPDEDDSGPLDADDDDDDAPRKGGKKGLNGSVPVENDEYTQLTDARARLRYNRAINMKAGMTEEDWEDEPSVLDERPVKGDPATMIHPTNGEDLTLADAIFNDQLKDSQRSTLARKLWNIDFVHKDGTNGAYFGKDAIKPFLPAKVWTGYKPPKRKSRSAKRRRIGVLDGKMLTAQRRVQMAEGKHVGSVDVDIPVLNAGVTVNPFSSRTLGIADRVTSQALSDERNPSMGEVTCGNLIFVDNLFFQAWLTVTLCRFQATAYALDAEVAAYAKACADAGENPKVKYLLNLINYYFAAWNPYFTVRTILLRAFPAANVHTDDTDNLAGRPGGNDPTLDTTSRVVRYTLGKVYDGYENPTASLADTEGRYKNARGEPDVSVPAFWGVVSGTRKAPSRPTYLTANPVVVYRQRWAETAERICVMNAETAPATVRETLAQQFNGEYIGEEVPITDDQGNPLLDDKGNAVVRDEYEAIRAPKYDVVIANEVAYEGIDLQQRTCRIIHADTPWTPSAFIQRNGRAVRQGNLYKRVDIFVFLTQNTVDYYRIQSIERKRSWLDSALDTQRGDYPMSDDEKDLLLLAVKSCHPDDKERLSEIVKRKLRAIENERRNRDFNGVKGKLLAAAGWRRRLAYQTVDPVGYKAVIDQSTALLRSTLNEAETMGGKDLGGAGIYGYQYAPSYFTVCARTLNNAQGSVARPNIFPREGEPRMESPQVPLVEDALYGAWLYKEEIDLLLAGESIPYRNDYLTSYNREPRKYTAVVQYAYTESVEGRKYAVRDPERENDAHRPAYFVPIYWVGRVNEMDPLKGTSGGTFVGVLDFWSGFDSGPSDYGTPSPRNAPKWTTEPFNAFNGRVNEWRLQQWFPSRGTSGENEIHGAACAVIPATYSEVTAWAARVGMTIPDNLTALHDRHGGFQPGRLGYASSDWIEAHGDSLHIDVLRHIVGLLDRKHVGVDATYFPFSEDGRLNVIKGSRFARQKSMTNRLVRFPLQIAGMRALGNEPPTVAEATTALAAAEAEYDVQKTARVEAGKSLTAAKNAIDKAEAAVIRHTAAVEAAQVALEADTAPLRQAVADAIAAIPTEVAAERAGLTEAEQGAEDSRRAVKTLESVPGVEVPAELVTKATVDEAAVVKAQAKLDKAEAAAQAKVDKANKRLDKASDAANARLDKATLARVTAEADGVQAVADKAAAEAALDAGKVTEEAAKVARDEAGDNVALAGAVNNHLILPGRAGYKEFLALARQSQAVKNTSSRAGEVTAREILEVFQTWFTGSTRKPREDWWGTPEHPSPLYESAAALTAQETEERIGAAADARVAQGGARKKRTVMINGPDGRVPRPETRAGMLRPGSLIVDPDDAEASVYRVTNATPSKNAETDEIEVTIVATFVGQWDTDPLAPEYRTDESTFVVDANTPYGDAQGYLTDQSAAWKSGVYGQKR